MFSPVLTNEEGWCKLPDLPEYDYLSCPLRIPVGCVDDEDVGSEHPGGQHHQHEGVAQPGASLTGPLALLPEREQLAKSS